MAGNRSRTVSSEILDFRDKEIVLDTDSSLIYIGKLVGVTRHFVVLADADVHDRRESSSMSEKYLVDCKRFGVRSNRKTVHIRLDRVVSFALLEEVIDY
jgi:small nuclear ribonucleoprotein (snRNP)-like protein